MKNLFEFYRESWDQLNVFGRCTLFPVLLIGFPLLLICALGTKRKD